MYTKTVLATGAALAGLAAAAPQAKYHSLSSLKARSPKLQHGMAVIADTTVVNGADAVDTTNGASSTVGSSNWGAIVASPPDNSSFDSIVGSWTVAGCSDPNDGTSGPWSTAVWVGIDGANNAASLVQSGHTCTANTDGSNSFYAWVEWLPEAEVPIDGFTVNEGDDFTVSIQVTSSTTAVIVVQDSTSGSVTTTSVSAPTPTATIEGVSAEWVVEDADANGFVPFANYGTISFSGAAAGAGNGSLVDALDLTYDLYNLILDDGSSSDGEQVSYFSAGSTSETFSFSYSS